jgi:glutathione peroxidase-family protein
MARPSRDFAQAQPQAKEELVPSCKVSSGPIFNFVNAIQVQDGFFLSLFSSPNMQQANAS